MSGLKLAEETPNPIVIEIGFREIKAGIAKEDDLPRIIVPGDNNSNLPDEIKAVKFPISSFENLEKVLSYCFQELLKGTNTKTSDHAMLLIPPPANTMAEREKLSEIFLGKFNAPSLLIDHTGCLPIGGSGRMSGVTLEVGADYVHVVCMRQGKVIPNTFKQVKFGAVDDIEQYFTHPENAVQNLVIEAINKCDANAKKDLWMNIVLSGSMTTTPAFVDRITKEIAKACPAPLKSKIYAMPNRQHLGWIGGACLALYPMMAPFFVTRQEFKESGVEIIRKKFK